MIRLPNKGGWSVLVTRYVAHQPLTPRIGTVMKLCFSHFEYRGVSGEGRPLDY